MKNLFYFVIPAVVLTSCGSEENKKEEGTKDSTVVVEAYKAGAEISEEGALDKTGFLAAMSGKDSLETKVTGKINSVCQVKGCWMMMDLGEGNEMRVKFLDYAFFVPKDASGKNATIEGWAKVDTISVAELQHLAEDAGQSKEEIEAIKEPKAELTFMAKGIIIK